MTTPTSLNKKVYDFLKRNPSELYNAQDITHQLSLNSKSYILVSTIISRLHKKGLVKRTKTQLTKGYLYSLNNTDKLESEYKKYLLPYDLDNPEKLIELITKTSFEKLRINEEIDYSPIKNNGFIQKYGRNYFNKKEVREFLAVIVGFCMCDGHIIGNLQQTRFFFRYERDAKKFIKDFKSIFKYGYLKNNLRLYKSKQSSCEVVICNKEFAKLLNYLGAPIGKKTNQNFVVPDWLYCGQKNVKMNFLSTIIGNEGSAPSNNRWRIQFVLSKEKEKAHNLLIFLNQIRSILFSIGIDTSHIQLRNQLGRQFCGRFYIKGKKNLTKFYKDLEFSYASEKQAILASLILKGKS